MDVAILTARNSSTTFPYTLLIRPTPVLDPRSMPPITVRVNGQDREVPEGHTITDLLAELGLGDRRVAVERNREVVPRAAHGSTLLADGDRLELVTFVGGG